MARRGKKTGSASLLELIGQTVMSREQVSDFVKGTNNGVSA